MAQHIVGELKGMCDATMDIYRHARKTYHYARLAIKRRDDERETGEEIRRALRAHDLADEAFD
jgi:hypothetical protein